MLLGVRPIGLASTTTTRRVPPAVPRSRASARPAFSPRSAGTRQSMISVLLPEPGGPADARQLAEAGLEGDAAQVVQPGASGSTPWRSPRRLRRGFPAIESQLAAQGLARQRGPACAATSAGVPDTTTRPPCRPAPGSHVDEVVGPPHQLSSCSTTSTVLPPSRSASRALGQPVDVARVQADRRLVEDVAHPDELRAEARRQPDAPRLAAGGGSTWSGRASGSRVPPRRAGQTRPASSSRTGSTAPPAAAGRRKRVSQRVHFLDRGRQQGRAAAGARP